MDACAGVRVLACACMKKQTCSTKEAKPACPFVPRSRTTATLELLLHCDASCKCCKASSLVRSASAACSHSRALPQRCCEEAGSTAGRYDRELNRW